MIILFSGFHLLAGPHIVGLERLRLAERRHRRCLVTNLKFCFWEIFICNIWNFVLTNLLFLFLDIKTFVLSFNAFVIFVLVIRYIFKLLFWSLGSYFLVFRCFKFLFWALTNLLFSCTLSFNTIVIWSFCFEFFFTF